MQACAAHGIGTNKCGCNHKTVPHVCHREHLGAELPHVLQHAEVPPLAQPLQRTNLPRTVTAAAA
jgi:hypothetical protein